MIISPQEFFTSLQKWSSLRSELLWVYEGIPEHCPVEFDHRYGYWVWLLRRGHVSVTMKDQTWKAQAGQWMILPHGPTTQQFSKDAKILSLHFRCQWPTGENLFDGRDAIVFQAKEFPQLERSATLLLHLIKRHFPKVRIDFSMQFGELPVFLRLQQLFFQWLLDFYSALVRQGRSLQQAGDCDDRLLRATKCLHEVPLHEGFPDTLLQKATGLGRAHLDRLYWKQFGVTTRAYWEHLREESATRSLEATQLSIKEIGFRLGFKQASHFTKWFHQRKETTPREYRLRSLEKRASGDL